MAGNNQGRPARWFGVQTAPRQEFYAQGEIQDKGYRVFVPWYMHETRSGRKVRSEKRALFEEYIFVYATPHQEIAPVRYAKGVVAILGLRSAPATIPVKVMDKILTLGCPDGYVSQQRAEALPPSLRVGDRCQINAGPFATFLGEIERIDTDGTIKLWVDIFGRATPVELPSSQVSDPVSP